MYQIIGYRNVNFKGQDGNDVTGVSFYLTAPITENGEGLTTEKVFLSTAKVAQNGYRPKIGDKVEIQYNRYGKVAAIVQVK